ncbi:MAG: hypothetical protein KGD70_03625 [Candidatus Lokiarchaeota archaeon]|nr:hypothetical protein [Candidatus Lokiarchaeota archaeon]
MSKKKIDQDSEDAHELILFRELSAKDSIKFEDEPLQYVDQEDKINMVYKLIPFGGNYLYSLVIKNQSADPITEVKISIIIPEFFKLCRSTPPTLTIESLESEDESNNEVIEEKQVKMEFELLNGDSQKQINLYLRPVLLEKKGKIRSFITFVNNKDFVRAIDTDTINIELNPFSIERKIIPRSEIKRFLEKPWIKKANKSIGISYDGIFDENYFFEQIIKTIQDVNFQLILKNQTNKISWFCGTDLVSGNDILVIGQIIEGKIEWLAASSNPHLLISVLTHFVNLFKHEMLQIGRISSEDQIYSLECKYCGNTLPYFPGRGKSIECNKCNYEQIIWN